MEDLKIAACKEGKPHWGNKGPQNAGNYNSIPFGIPFFEEGQENFLSDYGQFFLVSFQVMLPCSCYYTSDLGKLLFLRNGTSFRSSWDVIDNICW